MEGRREVWLEILSLALGVIGIVFFTIAAYFTAMFVIHWMLTGHARMVIGPGIVASWREQALGLVAVGVPGAVLLTAALSLRRFLGHGERDSAACTERSSAPARGQR